MDSRPAEQLILESGKSEALRQALGLVQDAQAPDGAPRYGASACRALARMIVCRTYAKPLMELVHLVFAAMRSSPDGRYETFFWSLERATVTGFRGQFAAMQGGDAILEVNDDGVTLFLDGGDFMVTFSRMPVLAALLEFMITVIGYRDLDDAFRGFQKTEPTAKQVGDAANGLSRALYAYLKDNLPTVQTQRRNRSFMEYMAEKGGGVMTSDAVDDAAVLNYWRAHAKPQADGSAKGDSVDAAEIQVDAKTYSGVFLMALRLSRTLRAAADRLAVAEARPIGIDREAGEVDPAEIEDLLCAVEEGGNLLSPLDEPPVNAIKFLNGRERDGLSGLVLEAGVGRRFPLSVMRAAVFGQGQAKITNALRQGKQGNDLDTVIARAAGHDYADQFTIFRDVSAHIDRMLLATYRALVEARRAEAADLATLLQPDLDLSDLKSDGAEHDLEFNSDDSDGVVSLAAHRAVGQFINAAEAGEGALGELNGRAKSALKSLSRQGFRPADRADAAVTEGFVQGYRPLKALKHEVDGFIRSEEPARDWSDQFADDRQVFTETFQMLYGQTQDGAHHV